MTSAIQFWFISLSVVSIHVGWHFHTAAFYIVSIILSIFHVQLASKIRLIILNRNNTQHNFKKVPWFLFPLFYIQVINMSKPDIVYVELAIRAMQGLKKKFHVNQHKKWRYRLR